MTDLTTKATVAPVQLTLNLEIEGLMLPDGTFGIAIPQIGDMVITGDEKKDGFRTTKSQFSKNLKRLCGENLTPTRAKTELGNQAINVITLEEFEIALAKLDRAGNLQAQHIRDELTGLGLHKSFADAFGKEFNQKEFLTHRNEHKKQFQPRFTNWLKHDGVTEGKDYGWHVSKLKRIVGCPVKSIEKYTPEELQKWNTAQTQYDVWRQSGLDHQDAVAKIAQNYAPANDIDLNF